MSRFRLVKGVLVAIAAIVVIGLVVAFGVRVYGGFRLHAAKRSYERIVGRLDLGALDRPPVPEAENAVTWLRPGIEAVVLLHGDRGTVGLLAAKPASDWTDAETASIETILERNRPALELLDRARGLSRSNWGIEYRKGNSAELPNLLGAMNAAKLLRVRAALALRDGDGETAVRSVETMGALARSLEAEPAMIVLLVGSAVERLQLGAARDLLASPDLRADILPRIAASLCDADLVVALHGSLQGDAAAIVHDVVTADLVGGLPRIVPASFARGMNDLLAASILEMNASAEGDLGAPVTAPLDQETRQTVGWLEKLASAYRPNVRSADARMLATSSARDFARLALALRHAAIAAGAYPPVLPTVPGVAEADPLSGEPWIYTTHPDGGAEIRTATTSAIARSIFPVGAPLADILDAWRLPPPAVH